MVLAILCTISCKTRTPLGQVLIEDYRPEQSQTDYFTDVNCLLDKYEGTWIGDYDSKTYDIVINKVRQSFNGKKEDRLLLRYKITDEGGSEVFSTLNLPDNSIHVVKGRHIENGGSPEEYYILFYQGKKYRCGQIGKMQINILDNNSKRLSLSFMPDRHSIRFKNCMNRPAKQVFPTDQESVLLTKQ